MCARFYLWLWPHWRMTMDDKELIEWLRTSGSDLDPCLDAADTIERLQRELGSAQWNEQQAWRAAAEAEAQRNEVRRERDEAREVLRQEADYCQGYADKYRDSDPARSARHQQRANRLRAALGGEG